MNKVGWETELSQHTTRTMVLGRKTVLIEALYEGWSPPRLRGWAVP